MSIKTQTSAPSFDSDLLTATAATAKSALQQASGRAVELVEAWVQAGNSAAVAEVAERGEGASRKAARRGLNVLRARGVRVDAAPRVTSLGGGTPAPASVEAWLVTPDAAGTTLFVIASRSATSRTESGFFYLHDEIGVHSANVGTLSGSGLKDALKRSSQGRGEAVRVPVEYVRKRIAEARELQKSRGIPEPLGMTSARQLLEPVPAELVPHPLEGEGLEVADDDVAELARRSGTLHAFHEFRGWLPERAAVEEMLKEIGEKLPAGGEEPSQELVQTTLKEAVAAATDRYFGPERRARLVERLRDSALSVLATQGEVRALELVATMRRIERSGLITDPPREVPFLSAFFEKAIATLALQSGGRLQIPRRQAEETAAEAPVNP